MAKRKGKIEIVGVEMGPPTEMELCLSDPAPAPPPADAAAAPEPEPESAPAPPPEPDFEARLKAVELVVAEQRAVITRQALDLLVATEHALQLRESRQKVERLKARAEEAKAASTAAKNAYSTAVDEHFELERDLANATPRLPFRDEPETMATAALVDGQVAIDTHGAPAYVAPPGDDESWRKVPLETMGIPEELPHSIVSILGESNLDTIGALSDYLAPAASGYCRKLTDVPGIGPVKAEKVEAALDAFWARWAEWQAHKPEPAAAPAEDDGPELTGEYDLDVSLRAGAGPVLPGVKATEEDDDEAEPDPDDDDDGSDEDDPTWDPETETYDEDDDYDPDEP